MAIRRLGRAPHPVTLATPTQTLYEIELSTPPSRAWRAAFLRLAPALTTAKYTPERDRLGFDGVRVTFCTTPSRLHQWLRQIDRWIAYANLAGAE